MELIYLLFYFGKDEHYTEDEINKALSAVPEDENTGMTEKYCFIQPLLCLALLLLLR